MECYLSITEMAKLRNVTTETLRYYDRIGLMKPDYLDKNNVRYYSVLKYEQLETIKELQQLGLGLKEIARYLSDRRISTSSDLLKKQQAFCEEKVRYYQAMHEKITRKSALLSELQHHAPALMQPELVRIGERFCYSSDLDVHDEISLSFACMKLENQIKEHDSLAPVYASDCYAGQFSINGDDLSRTRLLFIREQKEIPATEEMTLLPGGLYLRLYSADSFWQRTDVRTCFRKFAEKNGLHLSDKVIVISKIDYSITDIPEERLYEFQARVI